MKKANIVIFHLGGAGETFPPPRPWKIEFSGRTVAVQIHANHVLNIGVEKFGKLKMGGWGNVRKYTIEQFVYRYDI